MSDMNTGTVGLEAYTYVPTFQVLQPVPVTAAAAAEGTTPILERNLSAIFECLSSIQL